MLVSGVLDRKGREVATIPPTATVATLIAELARHRIGALVVSADGASIEGIVSERDVVRRLSELAGDLWDLPVAELMSTSVQTCRPEDDVAAIMALMTDRRIRHVPVVDGGRLCGIVSIGDVVKSRIDELERDRTELMEYITAR
jgi:CBS domain-containing protein